VKDNHPDLSYGDLWTLAGCSAVEFVGGPKVDHHFGRKDAADGKRCPHNGLLPDAAKGADHIREVFYRMGFNDREIVALCGAHTLGRCHVTRSGYDGPWTRNPLKFDNSFFKNLIYMEWRPKTWAGPLQFEDVETGELMMLPTDMALKTDPQFRVYAELYARDQEVFFNDFGAAFSKLLALGTAKVPPAPLSERERAGLEFREASMHGSLDVVKKWAPLADVHELERSSGRTALHKAAFWGHDGVVRYLLDECGLNPNAVDYNGDTALHDAVRFNHPNVVTLLLPKSDSTIKNKEGLDVLALAYKYGHEKIANIVKGHQSSKL